jgi:hypothetical protein
MKKENKKEIFPWKKVLIIAVGVLFVAMMVLSAMGTSWLQSFRTVMANDSVTIDFTLRDAMGQPVLTSDQNLYQTALTRGYPAFLTSSLTVKAGYIGNQPYTGVQAENYYISRTGETIKFGILGLELDELDAGVLGMKTGETKTIHFTFTDPLIITMKNYEFTAMGGNFTQTSVGDLVPIGFSESPMVKNVNGSESTPTNSVLRIAAVINKTVDAIEVQHRYPSADITVKEFK